MKTEFTRMEGVRLLALRGAMKLELQGIRIGNANAYKVAKQWLGIKGTKQQVMDVLNDYCDQLLSQCSPGDTENNETD